MVRFFPHFPKSTSYFRRVLDDRYIPTPPELHPSTTCARRRSPPPVAAAARRCSLPPLAARRCSLPPLAAAARSLSPPLATARDRHQNYCLPDLVNQEKSMTINSSAKRIQVAASRQWNGLARGLNGSCSPSITPLSACHYSTSSKSKVAYTGSEILNYMGGLDGEQKQLIHKLVNFRMKGGKKTRVRAIFHETLHRLARTDCDGVKIVTDALENVKPICEVAKVKIGGGVYDVPGVVARDRQQTLAVRWILDAAFKRRTNHSLRLEECLFAEITDAYRKRGTARKKREVLHGLASSNRSYAHFRWW